MPPNEETLQGASRHVKETEATVREHSCSGTLEDRYHLLPRALESSAADDMGGARGGQKRGGTFHGAAERTVP